VDSYDVRFWDTKKIADNTSGGRYRVRWAVNGQEHCKSFNNKALADGFLDDLKDAARDRRPFSPGTGLPAAETTEGEMVTWYEHARSYAEAKWPNLAPVSRRSVAEALIRQCCVGRSVRMTGRDESGGRLIRWPSRARRMLRRSDGGRGCRWRVHSDHGGCSARTRARQR